VKPVAVIAPVLPLTETGPGSAAVTAPDKDAEHVSVTTHAARNVHCISCY